MKLLKELLREIKSEDETSLFKGRGISRSNLKEKIEKLIEKSEGKERRRLLIYYALISGGKDELMGITYVIEKLEDVIQLLEPSYLLDKERRAIFKRLESLFL